MFMELFRLLAWNSSIASARNAINNNDKDPPQLLRSVLRAIDLVSGGRVPESSVNRRGTI